MLNEDLDTWVACWESYVNYAASQLKLDPNAKLAYIMALDRIDQCKMIAFMIIESSCCFIWIPRESAVSDLSYMVIQ